VATGPVPPYVNAAPQPLPGLLIGAALTFGIAASPLGPALQSEYTFGTHTAVLVTAEARKSQQWKSVASLASPQTGVYIVAGPAPFDPNVPAPFDPNSSARGGATPQAATFVIAGPAPFDPNVISPADPNAPASGGSVPGIGVFACAAPQPFDPANVAPQTFRAAVGFQGPTIRPYAVPQAGDPGVPASRVATSVASLRLGPVPPTQWTTPLPLDSIQGWIETPMFNPQGVLMPCQDGAPGDLWALAPQTFSAQSGTAIAPPTPLRMQFAAPQPLDSITAFDPNASARGGALPIIGDYLVAAPQPFEPNSVAPQTFRIAAAPIGLIQLWQWATPQPLDVIQGAIGAPAFNPQGPTIRQVVGAPKEQAPAGIAVTFTIERAGSVAGIGPVPPLVITSSSPVDPTPSAAQKFGSAAGGTLPGIGAYQVVSGRLPPETPSPDYSAPLVGPSLAIAYQFAAPQPSDALAAQTRAAVVGPIGVVRAFVTAWPLPLDVISAQISASRCLPVGAVPPYLTARPQQIDLTPPARIVRASVGIQGATVRSFVAAPPFTDLTTWGAAVSARHTASMAVITTVPIARIVLTGLSSIVLSDYPVRVALADYPVRTVL
jgi:hypothetical protein